MRTTVSRPNSRIPSESLGSSSAVFLAIFALRTSAKNGLMVNATNRESSEIRGALRVQQYPPCRSRRCIQRGGYPLLGFDNVHYPFAVIGNAFAGHLVPAVVHRVVERFLLGRVHTRKKRVMPRGRL